MATVSKFYLHDAATGNTGTMPGASTPFQYTAISFTGYATGGQTARAADGTVGPGQTSSVITAAANQAPQYWGHRRFVSEPLAAHTFANADGNWTFSAANAESNLNHNQQISLMIYAWRPGTGALVWAAQHGLSCWFAEPGSASTETAASATGAFFETLSILDGDILVFEVSDNFTQGMSSAYTSTFYYDGTTEASASNCASFVAPPSALTLFTGGTTYTETGYGKESG